MMRDQFKSLIGTRHLLTNDCWFEIGTINVQFGREIFVHVYIKALKPKSKTFRPEHIVIPRAFSFFPNKNLLCDELVDDLKIILMKFITAKIDECHCIIYFRCWICREKWCNGQHIIHSNDEEYIQEKRREYLEKYGMEALKKIDDERRKRIQDKDLIIFD
jgi:hypothetical protein